MSTGKQLKKAQKLYSLACAQLRLLQDRKLRLNWEKQTQVQSFNISLEAGQSRPTWILSAVANNSNYSLSQVSSYCCLPLHYKICRNLQNWMCFPPNMKTFIIVGSLCNREVARSASDPHGPIHLVITRRLPDPVGLYVRTCGWNPFIHSLIVTLMVCKISKQQNPTRQEAMILCDLTLTTLKYFCINHGDQKRFFQFEIIANVSVSFFCFIWIPMLWVHGHYKLLNSFSVGIYFRRQNLTSTDVRFWRLKSIPAL